MTLTTKDKQALKAKAHALKPVVLIGGKGISPTVIKEIDGALAHHELIKVRIASNDRDARRAMLAEISAATSSQLVQSIGNIGVFYRLKEVVKSAKKPKKNPLKKHKKNKKIRAAIDKKRTNSR